MKIPVRLIGVLFLFGQLEAAVITVANTAQLVSALQTYTAGDTIQLQDGTYTFAGAGVGIDIYKSLILKSVNGASHVTVTAPNATIGIRAGAPNITLDGLTITGAQFGAQAADWSNSYGGHVTNIVFRNLNVTTTGTSGHSVDFEGASNSVVELCTLNNSYNHGINVAQGANYNLIINNTVQGTQNGDGVAVVTSDHNIIAGNTTNNTGFDGVTLNGSQYNYVGMNTFNAPHNGVTLTQDLPSSRMSIGNYVGNNTMVLNGKTGSDGIWFNYNSNYNMAFLNDATGAQENGMAIFNSVGNYIQGNNFHQNPQGGIFMYTDPSGGSGPTVSDRNHIQRNYLNRHPANGGLTVNASTNFDFGFNYVAGDPAAINSPIAGFLVQASASGQPGATGAVYANVIRDLLEAEQIDGSAAGISLYLNRHLNGINHYTFTGANVTWDSNSTVLGGNYFSDFTAANGNPSNGATPYTNIINQQGQTGAYVDRYPYQSESLGHSYLVSAVLPGVGASLAAGTKKTISWTSQACILVDLTLVGGPSSPLTIATNAPDYGFFRWTVPAVATGSYNVRVDCKDSGANVKATTTGGQFTIASSDLVLLSPQSNQVLDASSLMLISWAKSANVTLPVDIYISYSNGAPYSLLQSGVTTDFVTTLGAPSTSFSQISIKIVSGAYSDSTDGVFTIRASGAGSVISPTVGSTLFIGSAYPVQWVSPQTTAYVDIDLVGGGSTRNIATKLADFSNYLMLVPPVPGSGEYLLFTFHAASGAVLNTAQSGTFTVTANPPQPVTIATLAGSPQSVAVNGTFATALQAAVRDANNAAVPGVSVTFSAPSSGASGIFLGLCNSTACTVTTDASGNATAPGFRANGTSGAYSVTATSPSASGTAAFSLTNSVVSTPASIAVVSGSPQSANVNVAFAPLKAIVRDASSNPVANASVSFTAPGSGASGTFASSATVLTDSTGTATAPTFTANATAGSYSVTASVGAFSTTFALTNTSVIGLQFVPITPCRVADTRLAAGPFGAPSIAGQTSRSFAIPNGACSIPSTAQAYSLNVTVVPSGTLGYLTVFPTGQAQPTVSTLNSVDGRVKANAAIVPAGSGGAVSFFASNTTDVVVDINGYFVSGSPAALVYFPLAPCRVADTRLTAGTFGGPYLPGQSTRAFPVRSSSCSVPAAAQAYSLNLTAVPRGPLGYLTAWPTGQNMPSTSSLNAVTGVVTSNSAILPAGTGGSINVFASNDTDLVIDIDGYFAAQGSGGLSLYNLTPCRAVDDRLPAGSPAFSGTQSFSITGSGCGAPATAQSFVLNATVVPQVPLGYLTLSAQGAAQPGVSTLNATDGVVAGNLAIVPTSNGSINAFASNSTYLILDIFGYFAP